MSLFLLTTGSTLLFKTPPAVAEDVSGRVEVAPNIRDAVAPLARTGATISYHPQTGRVNFIGALPGKSIASPMALPVIVSREGAARSFLATYGPAFGLVDEQRELIPTAAREMGRGRAKVRFQQVYNNIPVFGGELLVQLDARNSVTASMGEVLPDISMSTVPSIAAEMAAQIAVSMTDKWHDTVTADQLVATTPELWIYNPVLVGPGQNETVLVWRMEVSSLHDSSAYPVRELVLVDAQRGSIALHFSQIEESKIRHTYTANNGTSLPGTIVCTESNPSCTGGSALTRAAHIYAGETYDFFYESFGRDGINGSGMIMVSTTHYGVNYNNAGWTGTQMIYGDAYGYSNADDVVGHELTHGVIQYEANLYYYYQAGAINESLADVFGEFVDLTDGMGNDSEDVRWLMGEDISGLNAIRSMIDPTSFGDPDKMTSPYYFTGATDSGGVHYNSGINNKAAYLITDGGTFNGVTVNGLGIPKAARIYYEVMTNLLTAGSDYGDLYNALYQGCVNVIGGIEGITMSDCQEVRNATNAVEMNLQPIFDSNFSVDAPKCDANRAVKTTLFTDSMESGVGKWTFGALKGSNHWRYDATDDFFFPHSGLHFLYADDYPPDEADTFAAMKNSVLLPEGAYLHFYHAYGLEGPAYDGGVLEYSVNNGASWVRVSTFDYNGYDGTIAVGLNNPLEGQAAWLNDSHGYISSRVNLASLAGQSVRFRWRLAVDDYGYDRGWWLDDVLIYTCAPPAPDNDNFEDAIPFSTVPYSVMQSTESATFEDSEFVPSCVDNLAGTVWYRYSANTPRTLLMKTLGSDFDTVLAVWKLDQQQNLVEVACNDDVVGRTSEVKFSAEASTDYYIQIGGLDGQTGDINFNVVEPPANDLFANAIVVPGIPYTTIQETEASGMEAGEQTPSCTTAIVSSVWYQYTAETTGDLVLDTTGSDYDETVSVWTGSALGSLTEVGCVNSVLIAMGYPPTISVEQGTTYYIQIAGTPAPNKETGTLYFTLSVPPANDAFLKAASIPGLPYSNTQSTLDATLQFGEQVSLLCQNMMSTVWYSYTATTTGSLVISTAGSDYNTAIAVWTGSSLGSLTEQVCNDNDAGQTSLLTISAVQGTTYYIQIGGIHGVSGNLSLNVAETIAPSNNNFSGAVTLEAIPFTGSQSSIGSTLEGAEQLPSCAPTLQSTVWYSYTAAANGPLTFNTGGSSFNTVIAIWTGNALGNLTQVACNDNSGSQVSQVVINAVASTRYYIQIGGVAGGGGTGASGSVLNLVAAALPFNDTFTTAQAIPSFPYSRTQTTLGAWQDVGEPTTSCGPTMGASVWYKYTAPANRTVTFSTVGSTYDVVLTVWKGTTVGALTVVGCHNGLGNDAIVNVNTTAPTAYYIMIAGVNGAYGDLTFQAYLNNDYFANAISTGNLIVGLPYMRSQSTADTTLETGEKPGTCGLSVTNTVWYKYTAPVTAQVTFSTTGSNFNTVLSVWTGTTLATLTQIGCNDDGSTQPTSSLTVNTVAKGTYYIRIGGSSGANGALTFKADIVPPANAAPPRNYYTTATPTLTWNRITWAATYEIQVDDAAAFTAPLSFTRVVSGDALSVTVSTLARGQYFWRVRACPAAGACGAWSAVDSFLVDVP